MTSSVESRGVIPCPLVSYRVDVPLLAVPTPPQDALEAAQIAMALTHSFRTGMPVFFGDDGQPIFA
jgi:hypothetical protein